MAVYSTQPAARTSGGGHRWGNRRARLSGADHDPDPQARLSDAGTEPELLWVGVSHGLEARVARQEGIPFKAITTGKLRRSPNLKEIGRNIADAFRIPFGLLQAVAVVVRTRPAVVPPPAGT